MIIAKAQHTDLSELQSIETASFHSDFLSPRQMKYHCKNPRAIFLVLKIDDVSAGYILALMHGLGYARIYSLAVSTAYRGKGLGRLLVQAALDKLLTAKIRKVNLEVDEADLKTISLYQSFGFEVKSKLPAYYEDGRNALKMSKVLDD